MERSVLTKILQVAILSAVLWLTGCATPSAPVVPQQKTADAAPAAQVSAPPHTPVFPAGPLQPIVAAQTSGQAVAAAQPPTDMWDRIRSGFAMPDLESDQVGEREQWYVSRPDYMQRMTERSNKYIFHIVEELERRGMPTELALLPYIESAFNPQAVSSAKAAGMWQFMPATGTYFDLKQNAFRDDRRDVLASTRAALDYLQKLYGMFGDWHLALAAYNWGEGSVGRAIARNEKAGLPTAYLDLTMPAETRLYVPKLQAVKNIVANPQRFGVQLPLIENHPYFQVVDIARDIDVALAAQFAGVREEDFKALNPSQHRPVIFASGTPQILLPWDNANAFKRNFEAFALGQYASWTVLTLPNTMSVSEAAQKTGMSEKDLRSVNDIPPQMMIKAGSTLLVPRSASSQREVTSEVADNGRISLTPEQVTRRTTIKAGRRDSVASIARRYRVTTADVATWNNVKSGSSFSPGSSVVLYLPVRIASRSSNRNTASKRAAGKSAAHSRGGTPSKVRRK